MHRSPRRGRRSLGAMLDTALFGFAGLATAWLAYLLLALSLQPNWQILFLVVFWLLVAYLLLPRLHRILTHVYLPGYFIGRARTSDGLLGDPVNLAFRGSPAQLHAAMTAAGWTRADEISLASSARIVSSTLSRRSYPEAPVSPLHLFDRQQDFAYQQEVAGNPARRHHVRFWRCPEGWKLPGGYAVDWVAAGSYDRRVGLSLFTLQVTHRVAADVDAERDHIVDTLTRADPDVAVTVIRDFSAGYHARNGGGDTIETDGDLPVVDLRAVQARPAEEGPVAVPATWLDRRDRRPAPTVFGAGAAALRGAVALVLAGLLLLDPEAVQLTSSGGVDGRTSATAAGLAVVAVVDLGLGLATFLGRNWARVALMLFCVVTVMGAFVTELRTSSEPTPGTDLPVLALGILMLLALTSQRARDYALRRSRVTAAER